MWSRTNIVAFIAALSGMAIFLILSQRLPLGLVDDAYIFLRYGRNIHDGLGAVFNPGERVEGFSSPLWTLLASLLFRLDEEPSAWIGRASFAFGLLALLLSALAARRLHIRAFWLAPLMLALSPPFLCWSASGMETACFASGLLACALAFQIEWNRQRLPWISGLLAGLLVSMRMEGILLGMATLLFLAQEPGGGHSRRKRFLAAYLSGWLPPILLLTLSRYLYFHDWLPNTFYAKAGGGGWSLMRHGLGYAGAFAVSHIAWLIPLPWLLWKWKSLEAWERLFLLIVGMTTAGIIKVGGDHFSQYRFFVPTMPLLVCLSVSGWSRLLNRLGTMKWPRPWRWAAQAALAVMLLGAGWLLPYRLNIYQRAIVFFDEVSLARDLSTIGQFFHTKKAPGVSIAVIAAGAVPYYSGLPTLDMIGLLDRHIARAPALLGTEFLGHEKSDPTYVLDRKPTYILSVEAPYPAATELVAMPRFHQEYRPVLEPWGEFTVGYWMRRIP